MNDTPSPFAPFTPSPSIQSEHPPLRPETLPEKPETPKQKAAREKREAKAATAEKRAEGKSAKEMFGEQAPRQKRRATGEPKTVLKFDLQTILSAAALLNADDQVAFEKLVGILSDAGKPGRERLLAAIGKIFE